jgi:exonuclease SbcC
MILYSVHVENYKGIRGPLDVTFDPDSPNLLEGPNGAGKSTLLDAVQRCLVEGYNTAGAGAEEMRPRETALTPSISVVYGHSGSVYRIFKTFLDSPKAQLERRRPDGVFEAIAKGKAADEQVRGMLRSQATKAKENPGERLGLFSVLCSTQGKQELPALSEDALADIREMLGAQVCGSQGTAFERAVNRKYLSVWTPGGKPKKGKLSDIQTALVAAREDWEKCTAVMQQVSDLEVSARNQRALHRKTLERLHLAQAEHRSLAAVAQQVVELRTRRVSAVSRVETATAKYDQMRAQIDRIIDAGKKKRICEEARPKLEGAEATTRLARDTRTQEALGAQSDWELVSGTNPELQQFEQRIEQGAAFMEFGRELDTLEGRLRRASTADGGRTNLESRIATLNAPDPAMWRSIQEAGREFDEAKLVVDSLELRIEIAAEGDLTAEVLAGDPVGTMRLAAAQKAVARGDGHLRIRLPGIAVLDISGPSGDAVQWRARREASKSLLGRLLEPFGVAAWQDLGDRVQQREMLSSEIVVAKAEYAAAVGNDDLAELQARERELFAKRAEILLADPSWMQHPPDLAALRATANAVKVERERQQTETRTKWQTAERRRAEAEGVAASAEAARASNDTALEGAQSDLGALEADGKTITERQNELNGRRRECESSEAALVEIDAALTPLPADAPETAAAMLQGISVLESEIQSAREAYKQDEAAASAILRQGPYSSLAITEERVRQLEVDEAAENTRLGAILRLRMVVDSAKTKVLAGISAPVEERATALLERIIGRPFARIRLRDTMKLESVQPDGCSTDAALEQMSSGEREQIYFATRLALADVLGAQERHVVVLDDPLVDTDADRLSRALELINERSDHLQFVILTCHPERYLGLPKLTSRHMERVEAPAEAVATEVGS